MFDSNGGNREHRVAFLTGKKFFVRYQGICMKKSNRTHPAQFRRDVFPCELEQIRKRRKHLDLSDVPPESDPSTELGLIGLALSGGGIRSATFSLGVIQALAKHNILKKVDYLSTVSGGGFIG